MTEELKSMRDDIAELRRLYAQLINQYVTLSQSYHGLNETCRKYIEWIDALVKLGTLPNPENKQ